MKMILSRSKVAGRVQPRRPKQILNVFPKTSCHTFLMKRSTQSPMFDRINRSVFHSQAHSNNMRRQKQNLFSFPSFQHNKSTRLLSGSSCDISQSKNRNVRQQNTNLRQYVFVLSGHTNNFQLRLNNDYSESAHFRASFASKKTNTFQFGDEPLSDSAQNSAQVVAPKKEKTTRKKVTAGVPQKTKRKSTTAGVQENNLNQPSQDDFESDDIALFQQNQTSFLHREHQEDSHTSTSYSTSIIKNSEYPQTYVTSQSSDVTSQSSDITSQSSDITFQSSDITSQSSDVTSQSSDITSTPEQVQTLSILLEAIENCHTSEALQILEDQSKPLQVAQPLMFDCVLLLLRPLGPDAPLISRLFNALDQRGFFQAFGKEKTVLWTQLLKRATTDLPLLFRIHRRLVQFRPPHQVHASIVCHSAVKVLGDSVALPFLKKEYCQTPETCAAAINYFLEQKRAAIAWEFYFYAAECNFVSDIFLFERLLYFQARIQEPEELLLLMVLKNGGVIANDSASDKIVKQYLHPGAEESNPQSWPQSLQWLWTRDKPDPADSEQKKPDFPFLKPMTAPKLNVLLRTVVFAQKVIQGVEIMENAVQQFGRAVIDAETCVLFVSSLGRTGNFKALMPLMKLFPSEFFEERRVRTALIQAFSASVYAPIELAEELMFAAIDKGETPTLQDFSILIQGYFRRKQPEKAFKWLNRMREAGVPQDALLYVLCLIQASKAKDIETARQLFSVVNNEKLPPATLRNLVSILRGTFGADFQAEIDQLNRKYLAKLAKKKAHSLIH